MNKEMKTILFRIAVLMICVFELGYVLLNIGSVVYDLGVVKTFWAVFIPMMLIPVCFERNISSPEEDS